MLIESVECTKCEERFIAEDELVEVTALRLRCPYCLQYFAVCDADAGLAPERVANASVPVDIWEPAQSCDFRHSGRST
jgi:hypothetical protein